MDLQNIIFSISGFLIVMLLGIIGFFLSRQITVIEGLIDSVNALKLSLELVKNNEINFRGNCADRHNLINKRLDDFEEFIQSCQPVKTPVKRLGKPKNTTE
jgi:hypothetical protein